MIADVVKVPQQPPFSLHKIPQSILAIWFQVVPQLVTLLLVRFLKFRLGWILLNWTGTDVTILAWTKLNWLIVLWQDFGPVLLSLCTSTMKEQSVTQEKSCPIGKLYSNVGLALKQLNLISLFDNWSHNYLLLYTFNDHFCVCNWGDIML